MRWIAGILIGIGIAIVVIVVIIATMSWGAGQPGAFEAGVMKRVKYWRVGGKELSNPVPDSPQAVKEGAEHFQHHCQICHGLDGQGSGVPIVDKVSPPVADLRSDRVQGYSDGQLKWIIENGIRFSGMPSWKGILDDGEMWHIVRYIRHLPPKGSFGVPAVFKESEEEHEKMESGHDRSDHH
jgi:mono/diheme cytochrome c family protein